MHGGCDKDRYSDAERRGMGKGEERERLQKGCPRKRHGMSRNCESYFMNEAWHSFYGEKYP